MPILHLTPKHGVEKDKLSLRGKAKRFLTKKWLIRALVAFLGLFLLFVLGLSIVLAWISRDLPDPNTLITRDVPLTTRIYDRTGTHLLYEIHGDQNRSLAKIEDLPSYVPHATVAIEDKTFYTHHGISWQGLFRAFVVNTLEGKRIQGTSTLTQQLVKNAILSNERTLTRKLKEVLLALQIERVFSKDQILQLYLNEVPYGSTIYGIESASKNYFGKSAKDLTLDEAALLASIPQAPDLYSPYGTGSHGDNRTLLVERQHYVLQQMAEQGYITTQQRDDAIKVDTLKKLVPYKKNGNIQAPHFVTYVRSLLEAKYGQAAVETGGLNVITTLDWDKQQIAEDEVTKGVAARGAKYNFTNAALVALDPKNGQILSMVGSVNFFDTTHDGQVNVALSNRQPGSSFKPIVYAAGFIKGYTPQTTLWDVNTAFKTDLKDYEPKNYDLKEHGPVTVRQALQGSLNIPAVKMLYLVGVGRVLDFAEQLGYSTFGDRSRFGLSLVLGGGEVKLLEHTNAYAAFADQGTQYPTSAILKVTDSSGKTLEEWTRPDGTQVMDPGISERISDILSDNGSRAFVFGLHNYLTLANRPVAAKTGTTNDFHDAWTLGYTPSLVTGVWVGNNDNTSMKTGADGSQIAAPIWQGFMNRALQGTKVETFTPPPAETATKPVLLGTDTQQQVNIDKISGKLATDLTPPEDIIPQTVHVAHDILYYLDKDDPNGPAPADPTQDPQFNNWESAVQDWVKRNNWNTTSSAPTASDDVHTLANRPQVTILSPIQDAQLSSRSVTITTTIGAPRQIARVVAYSEGQLIGSSNSAPWTITAQFPGLFERGFHDIQVTAIDDVGNSGSATTTINLAADPVPLSLRITSPVSGAHLTMSSFPVTVTINSADNSDANKIDLYLQTSDGSTKLLSSEISPQGNTIQLQWTSDPGPGNYTLFPVLVDKESNTHPGDRTALFIDQ